MGLETSVPQRAPWRPLVLPADHHTVVHATGTPFESIDPCTLEPVAGLRSSSPADLDAAVARGADAFARREWSADGARRARVLAGFATALRARDRQLAELLTREQGKTYQESLAEVGGSADMVDWYAGLARGVFGRSATLGADAHGVILREPVGLVAVITPWNWPLTLLVRSLAPALAAGNACVVKPSSLTSAITVEALDLLGRQPDLPDGVLTCVLGPGAVVGDGLVGHEGVSMVAFTGETATGVAVMKRAAEGLRKVALELGGKSPNIVFADADIARALEGARSAAFTTCGQICTAGSRLLVQDEIAGEFAERLAEMVRGLRVGDGLDRGSQLGPLVSAAQREGVTRYIDLGRKEGRLAAQADVPAGDGYFVPPTMFTDLPADSPLIREEIFGPVVTLQTFAGEAEAVGMANDSEYGLAAGVWTSDLDRAWRVGSALACGTVWVNAYHHFYPEAEVGGYKRSGIGRQQGVEGLHEFTQTKHLNFNHGPPIAGGPGARSEQKDGR